MGFACSWIAVRTDDKAALLGQLGMVETGELVTPGCDQSAMSVHQTKDGWTIVFAEDFGWADTKQILTLSRFGMAVGVQYEDKVAMEATIHAADGGKSLWRVSHNAEEEEEPLEISGAPPKAFGAIRRKFERKQAEDDDVAWLPEIPLELARTISGYRVDEDAIEFVALDPVVAPKAKKRARPDKSQYPALGWQGRRTLTCSVIAVRTDAKKQVFDYLRQVETDRLVWPRCGHGGLSFYETDTGWIIFLSENIYWASDKRLRGLSEFGVAAKTSMDLGFSSPSYLKVAVDGQILLHVPPSSENIETHQLPADVRAALDEDWDKFGEDNQKGRTNYAMQRATRLLWGLNIGKPKYPFTALKRRWPWMWRATVLE